ncbi:MAG: tRNA uracil 4-sulfurtransferase ThiI [Ardenticatenia bacterium]|nr:tRNA uracil 4-sulfurtransferase ThiI [Ardenticatenia bacterium]
MTQNHSFPPILVLHYHEVGLKGKNRAFFERILARNVNRALRGLGPATTRRLRGRLLVEGVPASALPQAVARLQKVFGLATISPGVEVPPTLEAMARAAVALVDGERLPSFAVRARRAEKHYPFTSQEIGQVVGAAVVEATGAPVNLRRPHVEIFVEVANERAFVSTSRFRGPGGLPVGTSGVGVVLFSAGIDSPVAAWRMMKRGMEVVLVHFHSQPFADRSSEDKSRRLAAILAEWHGPIELVIVPLIDAQQAIIAYTPEPYRTLLYRRMMFRVAERVARARRAHALITGDSLGQVASQTIENLTAVTEATSMLVLRPLVGYDKSEIIAEAQRIGTYEVSILPQDDACTLLDPRRVETRATVEAVRHAEAGLDVEALADATFAQALSERIVPPWWHVQTETPRPEKEPSCPPS